MSESQNHPVDYTPWGCLQGVVGAVLGGVAGTALFIALPHEYLAVRTGESPGIGHYLAPLVTAFASLAVSGLCGVFIHPSWPRPVARAVFRMLGVVAALAVVMQIGNYAIEWSLDTGESSDLTTPFVELLFTTLCLFSAAPLSSAVTRRSTPEGHSTHAQFATAPDPTESE